MTRRYDVSGEKRSEAIRVGMEPGLYQFLTDYAADMGMSRSSAMRRLMIIGARCEAEHGNARMPATYDVISKGKMEAMVNRALERYTEHEM